MRGVQRGTQVALVRLVLVVRWQLALALRLRLARGHQPVEVELVGIPLPVDFGHYVFVVVVSARGKLGNELYLEEIIQQLQRKYIVLYETSRLYMFT